MKILIFGMIVEEVGDQTIMLENFLDTDALRRYLLVKYPGLENKPFMIAVNRQKVNENIPLNPSDEIALIPPFAGG